CFFFQAEDGIRDFHVTGVQTCALPISCRRPSGYSRRAPAIPVPGSEAKVPSSVSSQPGWGTVSLLRKTTYSPRASARPSLQAAKIGRASCRERVERGEVDGAVKKQRAP